MTEEADRAEAPGAAFERGRAWRASLTAAGTSALSEASFALIDSAVHPDLLLSWLRVLHTLLCLGAIAWLLARRRSPTVPLADATFLLVALPFLAIFWIADAQMAALAEPWIPFLGPKLLMVGIALLAPSTLAVGVGLILGLAGESFLLWLGFAPRIRLLGGAWEPWVTLVFGAVALVLLAYRSRSLSLERRFFEARAEAEALERLARLFLAMRDQANTPLQTIELTTTLVSESLPEAAADMARVQRAVERLKGLMREISGFEDVMTWARGDESIDAHAVFVQLQQVLGEETRRRRGSLKA